jgi:hypothetical protein
MPAGLVTVLGALLLTSAIFLTPRPGLGQPASSPAAGPAATPAKVTLELTASRYGMVVFGGQEQRVGPRLSAVVRDVPADETLKFLPDGDYAPGAEVKATEGVPVPPGGQKTAAGAVGVVESLDKKVGEDGQPYVIQWKEPGAGKSTVAARYLVPVKRTEAEEAFSLDSPVEGRTRVVAHYLSRVEAEGSGVIENESNLPADQKKEAAVIVAMMDVVRKLGERGLGFRAVTMDAKDANKVSSTGTKFEFYGLAFENATKLAPSGLTTESDRIWADIPLKDGKVRRVMCEDFLLKDPADVLASGQGQVLRALIEKHVPKLATSSEKDGIEHVKVVFSGLIVDPVK